MPIKTLATRNGYDVFINEEKVGSVTKKLDVCDVVLWQIDGTANKHTSLSGAVEGAIVAKIMQLSDEADESLSFNTTRISGNIYRFTINADNEENVRALLLHAKKKIERVEAIFDEIVRLEEELGRYVSKKEATTK